MAPLLLPWTSLCPLSCLGPKTLWETLCSRRWMLVAGQVLAGQADVPKLGRWPQTGRRLPLHSSSFLPTMSASQHAPCVLLSLQVIFTTGGKKKDAISLHSTLKQVTLAPSKKHPTDGSGPLCSEKQQTSWAVGRLLKFHASCRSNGLKLLGPEWQRG